MKKDWMINDSELDDEQLAILRLTIEGKSCIVSGCAGSGKSVLALWIAKRIQDKFGDDYQIVVFTKALCRYMNAGRESIGLKKKFTYLHDWVHKKCKPKSSFFIVDEIQDFSVDEIRDFINATNVHFFFFGDSAQSIYDGMHTDAGIKHTVSVDDIRVLLPEAREAKYFPLYRNHRLPIPVARVAQNVGVGLAPFDEKTYTSTENEMPRFIAYLSEDSQLSAIHKIIKDRQLSDVAILLPHNDDVRRVYEKLVNLGGNYEVKYRDSDDYHNNQETLDFTTPNPKVMTYHSAKGLQFEAVFLPLVEKSSPKERKSLYVAMTRTYRYLYVMYSNQLPAVLNQVDSQLYKTSEDDAGDLKDI